MTDIPSTFIRSHMLSWPISFSWRRAVWMRLGALTGLTASIIILLTISAPFASPSLASIRLIAQIQFMHGMATLACATFMNIGALRARFAPAFFLGGVFLYCFPAYGRALGLLVWVFPVEVFGVVSFGSGWLILAWSAGDIDREAEEVGHRS